MHSKSFPVEILDVCRKETHIQCPCCIIILFSGSYRYQNLNQFAQRTRPYGLLIKQLNCGAAGKTLPAKFGYFTHLLCGHFVKKINEILLSHQNNMNQALACNFTLPRLSTIINNIKKQILIHINFLKNTFIMNNYLLQFIMGRYQVNLKSLCIIYNYRYTYISLNTDLFTRYICLGSPDSLSKVGVNFSVLVQQLGV